MSGETHLAIDLGTSNTVAVVRRDGQLPRPLLFDGSPLLPSGVFLDSTGVPHTGRDAQRMARTRPDRFEPHPKQRIDEGTVLLGTDVVPVETLLAALLRRVAQAAGEAGVTGVPPGVPAVPGVAGVHAMSPVPGVPAVPGVPGVPAVPAVPAVLTCPAGWGRRRRNVLLAAAGLAGLGAARLVDEPVAAAAYCLDVLGDRIPAGRSLAVFDFGGGTLDVAVVRSGASGLEVLTSGGLANLGGLDLDAVLVEHLLAGILRTDPALGQQLSDPLSERQPFWDEVRAAKEMLSRTAVAPVHLPGGRAAVHLTREEVERLTSPLVDRAVTATRTVLSHVDGADLAGIFLVGGSSRLPLVASRLHAAFGIAPQVPEQPELPVAYGALLVPRLGLTAARGPDIAVTEQIVAERAAAQRAVTERVVGQRAVADRAVTDRTVATQAATERAATGRGTRSAGATPRRRRLMLAAFAVGVAAAITVAALLVPGLRASGQGKPSTSTSAVAVAASSGHASSAPSTVPVPQNFVACDLASHGAFCPAHPMCWGTISQADPPTATPIDCTVVHRWQTFAAGFPSSGSGRDLAHDPAVAATCVDSVLAARSTVATDTQGWQIKEIGQLTGGRIVFHCVAKPSTSLEWGGSAFH